LQGFEANRKFYSSTRVMKSTRCPYVKEYWVRKDRTLVPLVAQYSEPYFIGLSILHWFLNHASHKLFGSNFDPLQFWPWIDFYSLDSAWRKICLDLISSFRCLLYIIILG
jgi:hypothetical protein